MSEQPPNSQTKIAVELNSEENKSDSPKSKTEEEILPSSADLSAPSNHPFFPQEKSQDQKNSANYTNVVQNLSSQASNPNNPQDLSLKDYFPDYQSLFNTLQFLLESFSDSEVSQPLPETAPDIILTQKPPFHGRVLMETPSGHDLQNFLQIYSKSCGLGYFLLDIAQWSKEMSVKQSEILIQFFQNQSSEIPFILYIPFDPFLRQLTNESYLFSHLINLLTNLTVKLQKNIILFSVHPDIGIPERILDFFDLEFSLGLPDFSTRKQFLATLLEKFTPKAMDIDYDHLALQLEGWNFMDLRRFVKNATLLFLSEQNVQLKPKILETSFLTNLLEKSIIRAPSHKAPNSRPLFSSDITSSQSNPLSEKIISTPDRRFSQQLYQDAASRDYEKLVIILDKLQKGIVLQQFERELLGDYPFFLKIEPKQAVQKLNKAKIRIEKIQRLIPSAKNQTT